jgi:ABC-2 type transport system ATP-binding protein
MLEISDLTRNYGDFTAVNKLNLTVKEGAIFGFLGHNGAGKTTTVLMLTTLIEPTSGKALINGIDIVRNNLEVRNQIGYLPENVNLYSELTTAENLWFFGKLSGIEKVEKRIDEVLNLLNFTPWKHKKVGHMSKGMRQRVGIAQAILHQPKILFLDEPASGLDPQGTIEIRELLLMLNKRYGTTIFMNTHLLSEVTKICTDIGILKQGNLLLSGSIDSIQKKFPQEKSLEEIYIKIN